MMFAKMIWSGVGTQLGTTAAEIIHVANVCWGIGIIMSIMVVTTASHAQAKEIAPLQLLQAVPLPGFTGDFDHFAVDEKDGRLFLAGEDHKTVEVLDLRTGRRSKSIAGFGTPHSIFYLPETDRILVTDGEKGVLQILRGSDYAMVDHIEGLAGAGLGAARCCNTDPVCRYGRERRPSRLLLPRRHRPAEQQESW